MVTVYSLVSSYSARGRRDEVVFYRAVKYRPTEVEVRNVLVYTFCYVIQDVVLLASGSMILCLRLCIPISTHVFVCCILRRSLRLSFFVSSSRFFHAGCAYKNI